MNKGIAMKLPPPREQGELSLEEALAARRSVREFDAERLTAEQLSQLLWAAQGATASDGRRTAPSAGALYPLEVDVATPDGLFRYRPASHRLDERTDRDVRASVWEAALRQDPLRDAPAIFAISAVVARTEARYGARATRYVHLEAGHAAQNILLQAVALGLVAVPMGAFDDEQLRGALALSEDETPLYLIPVGHAA